MESRATRLYDDCGSGGWGQQFSYDHYDNLTKAVISGRTGVTWNPGYSSTTNQVNGATYDANGNMTNDGLTNTYTWNEFSKMASVNKSGNNCATSGDCLVYDAFGRMAEFDSGSTYTEVWYTQIGKTAFMNGNGQRYSYWPTPGGGTLLQSGGSYYYQHEDWLGSARISSSVVGRTIIDDRAYAPYGEVYNEFGSLAQNETMFGAITQDVVSGMYDTPNRELAGSNQGRWLSPDPAGAGWNQYAYPANPNSSVDPLGLCPQCDTPRYDQLNDAMNSWQGDCFIDPFCSPDYYLNGIQVPTSVAQRLLLVGQGGGGGYWAMLSPGYYQQHGPDDDPTYDWVDPTWVYVTVNNATQAANNETLSWAWNFTKALVKGPSTGPGSCVGLFTDTVTAPLKQIQSAVKNYVPLIVGAMQAGPSGAAMYMQQLNNMVASGAAEADPQVAAVVTTAGAAAATAAPYASAAAPYAGAGGADLVLAYGLGTELKAGFNGQCRW